MIVVFDCDDELACRACFFESSSHEFACLED
jgi:hypothetical protein